jgi:hypothetical protein
MRIVGGSHILDVATPDGPGSNVAWNVTAGSDGDDFWKIRCAKRSTCSHFS